MNNRNLISVLGSDRLLLATFIGIIITAAALTWLAVAAFRVIL
jgi:hypothetical protein